MVCRVVVVVEWFESEMLNLQFCQIEAQVYRMEHSVVLSISI